MVHLNRIYTGSGDAGQTGLGDGTRVAKTHPRITAYGGVDELNSILGVALASTLPAPFHRWIQHVQNDLFDLGADLCVPEPTEPPQQEQLRVTEQQVRQLEAWIDRANASLQPLNSFVLPGGSSASAFLHFARTVCRRVEIDVLHLAAAERVNPQATVYLNRLSDLLFVLARACNDNGRGDVTWIPGKHRTGDE